jgi:uncharacterized protein YciI
MYFAVAVSAGPAFPAGKKLTEVPMKEHLEHIKYLMRRKLVMIGGPFVESNGGMAVVEADSEQQLRQRAAQSPLIADGVLAFDWIHPWQIVVRGKVSHTMYYVALYERGPAYPAGVKVEELLLTGYQGYMKQRLAEGELVMGGPFSDDSGMMTILNVASTDEAHTFVATDALISKQIFKLASMNAWYVMMGWAIGAGEAEVIPASLTQF